MDDKYVVTPLQPMSTDKTSASTDSRAVTSTQNQRDTVSSSSTLPVSGAEVTDETTKSTATPSTSTTHENDTLPGSFPGTAGSTLPATPGQTVSRTLSSGAPQQIDTTITGSSTTSTVNVPSNSNTNNRVSTASSTAWSPISNTFSIPSNRSSGSGEEETPTSSVTGSPLKYLAGVAAGAAGAAGLTGIAATLAGKDEKSSDSKTVESQDKEGTPSSENNSSGIERSVSGPAAPALGSIPEAPVTESGKTAPVTSTLSAPSTLGQQDKAPGIDRSAQGQTVTAAPVASITPDVPEVQTSKTSASSLPSVQGSSETAHKTQPATVDSGKQTDSVVLDYERELRKEISTEADQKTQNAPVGSDKQIASGVVDYEREMRSDILGNQATSGQGINTSLPRTTETSTTSQQTSSSTDAPKIKFAGSPEATKDSFLSDTSDSVNKVTQPTASSAKPLETPATSQSQAIGTQQAGWQSLPTQDTTRDLPTSASSQQVIQPNNIVESTSQDIASSVQQQRSVAGTTAPQAPTGSSTQSSTDTASQSQGTTATDQSIENQAHVTNLEDKQRDSASAVDQRSSTTAPTTANTGLTTAISELASSARTGSSSQYYTGVTPTNQANVGQLTDRQRDVFSAVQQQRPDATSTVTNPTGSSSQAPDSLTVGQTANGSIDVAEQAYGHRTVTSALPQQISTISSSATASDASDLTNRQREVSSGIQQQRHDIASAINGSTGPSTQQQTGSSSHAQDNFTAAKTANGNVDVAEQTYGHRDVTSAIPQQASAGSSSATTSTGATTQDTTGTNSRGQDSFNIGQASTGVVDPAEAAYKHRDVTLVFSNGNVNTATGTSTQHTQATSPDNSTVQGRQQEIASGMQQQRSDNVTRTGTTQASSIGQESDIQPSSSRTVSIPAGVSPLPTPTATIVERIDTTGSSVTKKYYIDSLESHGETVNAGHLQQLEFDTPEAAQQHVERIVSTHANTPALVTAGAAAGGWTLWQTIKHGLGYDDVSTESTGDQSVIAGSSAVTSEGTSSGQHDGTTLQAQNDTVSSIQHQPEVGKQVPLTTEQSKTLNGASSVNLQGSAENYGTSDGNTSSGDQPVIFKNGKIIIAGHSQESGHAHEEETTTEETTAEETTTDQSGQTVVTRNVIASGDSLDNSTTQQFSTSGSQQGLALEQLKQTLPAAEYERFASTIGNVSNAGGSEVRYVLDNSTTPQPSTSGGQQGLTLEQLKQTLPASEYERFVSSIGNVSNTGGSNERYILGNSIQQISTSGSQQGLTLDQLKQTLPAAEYERFASSIGNISTTGSSGERYIVTQSDADASSGTVSGQQEFTLSTRELIVPESQDLSASFLQTVLSPMEYSWYLNGWYQIIVSGLQKRIIVSNQQTGSNTSDLSRSKTVTPRPAPTGATESTTSEPGTQRVITTTTSTSSTAASIDGSSTSTRRILISGNSASDLSALEQSMTAEEYKYLIPTAPSQATSQRIITSIGTSLSDSELNRLIGTSGTYRTITTTSSNGTSIQRTVISGANASLSDEEFSRLVSSSSEFRTITNTSAAGFASSFSETFSSTTESSVEEQRFISTTGGRQGLNIEEMATQIAEAEAETETEGWRTPRQDRLSSDASFVTTETTYYETTGNADLPSTFAASEEGPAAADATVPVDAPNQLTAGMSLFG